MHDECFSAKGWVVVEKTAPFVRKHDAVLAGGTALALHIGHRISGDLDFFTNKTFFADEVIFNLGQLGLPLRMMDKGERHIIASIDGIKFSLFVYPYPFTALLVPYRGLLVAGIADIAAMKVIAISQRGTRRDFIDLYCIMQQASVHDVVRTMSEKFGKEGNNAIHIGKSLVFFADADSDYDPEYLPGKQIKWETVKTFFRKNVKSFVYSLSEA